MLHCAPLRERDGMHCALNVSGERSACFSFLLHFFRVGSPGQKSADGTCTQLHRPGSGVASYMRTISCELKGHLETACEGLVDRRRS